MKNDELNPMQSFQLIEEMISTAKNKLADDGFLFILWGWLVFSAAMIHYLTLLFNVPFGYLTWATMMPIGAIVSIVYSTRKNQKEKTKTYVDAYLGYVWAAFGVALFVTLIFMPVHSMKTTYFFLMVLYGIATLISGGLLSFKPLVYGSLFSFGFAVISVFAGNREQLLCISAALLFSYIIPGHLLRAKYKSQLQHV